MVLKYLNKASGKELMHLDCGHTKVVSFSYADCAGLHNDRRSTMGYCVFLRENLVS